MFAHFVHIKYDYVDRITEMRWVIDDYRVSQVCDLLLLAVARARWLMEVERVKTFKPTNSNLSTVLSLAQNQRSPWKRANFLLKRKGRLWIFLLIWLLNQCLDLDLQYCIESSMHKFSCLVSTQLYIYNGRTWEKSMFQIPFMAWLSPRQVPKKADMGTKSSCMVSNALPEPNSVTTL